MRLSALKFDNPNNTCQSLRILAELVRHGDLLLAGADVSDESSDPTGAKLRMSIIEPRQARPTRRESRRADTAK